MDTFVTQPDEGGPHPIVLFYMDAIGVREELKDMARRIGTAGYCVLLPNLFYRVAGIDEVLLDAKQIEVKGSDERKRFWGLVREREQRTGGVGYPPAARLCAGAGRRGAAAGRLRRLLPVRPVRLHGRGALSGRDRGGGELLRRPASSPTGRIRPTSGPATLQPNCTSLLPRTTPGCRTRRSRRWRSASKARPCGTGSSVMPAPITASPSPTGTATTRRQRNAHWERMFALFRRKPRLTARANPHCSGISLKRRTGEPSWMHDRRNRQDRQDGCRVAVAAHGYPVSCRPRARHRARLHRRLLGHQDARHLSLRLLRPAIVFVQLPNTIPAPAGRASRRRSTRASWHCTRTAACSCSGPRCCAASATPIWAMSSPTARRRPATASA